MPAKGRDTIDLTDHNAGVVEDLLTMLERNEPMRELGYSLDEPAMMRLRALRERLHEGHGPVMRWDDACPCKHCAPTVAKTITVPNPDASSSWVTIDGAKYCICGTYTETDTAGNCSHCGKQKYAYNAGSSGL